MQRMFAYYLFFYFFVSHLVAVVYVPRIPMYATTLKRKFSFKSPMMLISRRDRKLKEKKFKKFQQIKTSPWCYTKPFLSTLWYGLLEKNYHMVRVYHRFKEYREFQSFFAIPKFMILLSRLFWYS